MSALASDPYAVVPRPASAMRYPKVDLPPGEGERFLTHLRTYLAAMYPGCGPGRCNRLTERVRRSGHFGRLGEIAGLLVDTMVRHELTDYDRLLRINGRGGGLSREEARMVVAQEVKDITAAWRLGSAEADPAYVELRRDLKRRRQKKGRRKSSPGVIAHENETIAAFLSGWLERQEATARIAEREPGPSPKWRRADCGREPAPPSWWERTTPKARQETNEAPALTAEAFANGQLNSPDAAS